jgi:hypothetical protein
MHAKVGAGHTLDISESVKEAVETAQTVKRAAVNIDYKCPRSDSLDLLHN